MLAARSDRAIRLCRIDPAACCDVTEASWPTDQPSSPPPTGPSSAASSLLEQLPMLARSSSARDAAALTQKVGGGSGRVISRNAAEEKLTVLEPSEAIRFVKNERKRETRSTLDRSLAAHRVQARPSHTSARAAQPCPSL